MSVCCQSWKRYALRSTEPGVVTEYAVPTQEYEALDAAYASVLVYTYSHRALNCSRRRLPNFNMFDYSASGTSVNKIAHSSCAPTSCLWPSQPVPPHLLHLPQIKGLLIYKDTLLVGCVLRVRHSVGWYNAAM